MAAAACERQRQAALWSRWRLPIPLCCCPGVPCCRLPLEGTSSVHSELRQARKRTDIALLLPVRAPGQLRWCCTGGLREQKAREDEVQKTDTLPASAARIGGTGDGCGALGLAINH